MAVQNARPPWCDGMGGPSWSVEPLELGLLSWNSGNYKPNLKISIRFNGHKIMFEIAIKTCEHTLFLYFIIVDQ